MCEAFQSFNDWTKRLLNSYYDPYNNPIKLHIFIAIFQKRKQNLRLKKRIYLAQVMLLFSHIPVDAEAEQEN